MYCLGIDISQVGCTTSTWMWVCGSIGGLLSVLHFVFTDLSVCLFTVPPVCLFTDAIVRLFTDPPVCLFVDDIVSLFTDPPVCLC